MGRSSKYTPELAAKICDLLETGKTLRAVCRDDDELPSEAAVRRWVVSDTNGFASQYLRARETGYLAMADEIAEIADDGANDTIEDEDGHVTTNWDVLGRSKLRVDTRKWLLSKALPKIYGDKITNEMTGPNGQPLFTDDQRDKKLAALADAVRKRIAQNNSVEGDDVSDLA